MKRERSPSLTRSFPCFRSRLEARVGVSARRQPAPPRDDYVAVHKRLRGLNSSLNRSGAAPNSSDKRSRDEMSAPTLTAAEPGSPASPSSGSRATLVQFADFLSAAPLDRSACLSPSDALVLAAEMAADFHSEASILYDMLSDIKTPTEEGCAVDELMRRLRYLLSDGGNQLAASASASASAAGNAQAQLANVRGVYNGLIRVYVFLYQRYYRAFVVLEVSELLTACWQRLLAFVVEYRILDEAFVGKVFEHVGRIASP